MIVGNKSYISDIQNSIFSTLEVDAACHPPKKSANFVPVALLKSINNEIQVLTK
jgi:hypothetical protein